MKASVKTFIYEWSVSEGKEKLVFPKLDFSPDQVGNLDRVLRDTDNKVTLTISVVKKKLQFEPIKSQVHIVRMSCMSGGQKFLISGFKSPDSRAVAMKSLADTKEPVTITIEDKQQRLFDNADKERSQAGEQKEFEADPEPNKAGVFEKPNHIKVGFPKSYLLKASIDWVRYKGKFYIGYDIECPRYSSGSPVSINDKVNPPFDKLSDALLTAAEKVQAFIVESCKKQIQARAKKLVREAIEKYIDSQ